MFNGENLELSELKDNEGLRRFIKNVIWNVKLDIYWKTNYLKNTVIKCKYENCTFKIAISRFCK